MGWTRKCWQFHDPESVEMAARMGAGQDRVRQKAQARRACRKTGRGARTLSEVWDITLATQDDIPLCRRSNAAMVAMGARPKRRDVELVSHRGETSECDFLLSDRGHVFEAVQVCSDLGDQETKRREIKGLCAACTRFGIKKGTIVTEDTFDAWEIDGLRIDVIPFFRYAMIKP